MVTMPVIVGRAAVSVIVCTPAPAMLKLIVSVPYAPTATTSALTFALLFADVIASRKVTKPSTAIVSPVPVTVMVAARAVIAVRPISVKLSTPTK